MPIPPKSLSRVFHTVPAKAALAVGGAALASGAALAFPAAASAASHSADSANLVILPTHSHGPFPSISFPGLPGTSYPTAGNPTVISVGKKKSAAPSPSSQGQFSYVSTFSPAPVASTAPPNTASAACLANGQPVAGPGGDLDLPGISGVSRDAGHAGALPITGLGPAEMLPPQIDSANLGQLTVTRPVDATSANLAMVASSGYRFPCVHMEIGAGNGFANAEYALVNAGLVADDRSGTTETLTWTYSTILWTYTLPGSTAVHQGSGQINAQPNRTNTSLARDSKLVAAGTIGLTLLVALALLTLYVVGRRRSRARYRARYYRRTALRAQREAMAATAVPVLRPTEPVEPDEVWEPQTVETARFAEAPGAAGAYEPLTAAEAPRVAEDEGVALSETAEDGEPEPVEAGEPVAPVERTHPEPEAESTESETAESEAAALEGSESGAVESEVAESELAESELAESESTQPPEPTESAAAETETAETAETAETGAERLAASEEAAPVAESEDVTGSEQEPEPETGPTAQQDDGAAHQEQEAEPEEAAEPPATSRSQAVEATDSTASAKTKDESSAEPARTRLTKSTKPSKPESRKVSGDEHEPAAAR